MKKILRRPLIPIITDILEYRQAGMNTINYTRKVIEKYGDVADVSFTGVRNYFIHDPEVIKEMLTTQSGKFKRTNFFRAFRKLLGNGLFTSDGDDHKKQRRMLKPAFLPQRIEGYADVMVQCALDEMATWKDGDTIDVNTAMTRITLQVITKTMFGSQLDESIIELVNKNMPLVFDIMNKVLLNPFYTYCLIKDIRIPIVKKFYRVKAELDTIVNSIIAANRKAADESGTDLLTMLIQMREEETGYGMTDEQIRDEIMTFFLAGHETTTLALTWAIYLVGKHPHIEKEFYAEVSNIIGNGKPTAADYMTLKKTKNIFKETLRLRPPAWTLARLTTEDVVIKDYHFPKNSVLWTVTYLLHHSEKYFDNAEEFIPSRWDNEQIKDIPRYAYFPFGGGNRMCIGEGFAWMEGVLVLATIASRFHLQLPAGFTTDINPVFSLKTKDRVMAKVVAVTP